MTDNDIIKALEEHYRQVDAGYSTHLEYGGKGDEHEEKYIYMLRDILDLINRQKAEIEGLQKLVNLSIETQNEMNDTIINQKAEIERLTARNFELSEQEWYSADDYPKEDGTYLVQTSTGTITTARFYAFKSFPATKILPACHRPASWQSNRNVVKWTNLPEPPKGD